MIRSLEVLDSSAKFICGPSLCVDHLLAMCGSHSIPDLVDNRMKQDISVEKKTPLEEKPLYLERCKTPFPKEEVFKSARVGLHSNKVSNSNEGINKRTSVTK